MKNQKYLTIGETANLLGVTTQTVRNYAKRGMLNYTRTPGGNRLFTKEEVHKLLGIEVDSNIVFYVRSSSGNQQSMRHQEDKLREKHGEPLKVYKDGASGLNENRKGLLRLLKDAKEGKFDKVIITNHDRLSRFGYSYLELLLKEYGVEIIATEEIKEKSMYDELIEDFMSLIASFSGKFYKIRSKENQKRLIKHISEVLDKED